MVKSGQSLLPLTADDIADILRRASDSDVPLTAKEAAAQARCSRAPTETEVTEILNRAVAEGSLFQVPAKTAKGKLRYWGNDPEQFLSSQLLRVLEAASKPATVKELLKLVSPAISSKVTEVTQRLEALTASGSLFLIPPATGKGLPGYWIRSPNDWGKVLVRKKLEAAGSQTAEQLTKLIRFLGVEAATTLLNEMVTQHELYRHPPLGKVKKALLSTAPPRPEPYLQPVAEQLKQVITKLRAEQVPEEQLRRSVLQLVEDAGIVFGTTSTLTSPRSPARSVDLEQHIRKLDPGADRGALVGIRDLRRLAAIPKVDFDATVLELSRQGILSLHRHDFPASLSDQERDDLVVDRQGTYYVGVALRQNRAVNDG